MGPSLSRSVSWHDALGPPVSGATSNGQVFVELTSSASTHPSTLPSESNPSFMSLDGSTSATPSPGSNTREARLGDVGLVVLDEVHYLGDPHRGSVWEEVIINCPRHIQLLCMSATVRNPEDLGNWISKEHQVRVQGFGTVPALGFGAPSSKHFSGCLHPVLHVSV